MAHSESGSGVPMTKLWCQGRALDGRQCERHLFHDGPCTYPASPGGETPTSDRDELRAVFVEGALWRGQQKAISADSLMKEVARRDRDGFFSAGPSTSGEPPTLTSLQLRAAAKVGADKVAPLGAHCSGDGWVAFNAWLEQRFPSGLGEPVPPEAPDTDRIYPCDMCGVLRSKNEGGTVFTVCDDCWKIAYPSKPGVSGGGVSSPGEPDAIAELRESLHKERDLDHSDEFGADERRTDALLESVSRELEEMRLTLAASENLRRETNERMTRANLTANGLRGELDALRQTKDGAYTERNQVVAALSKLFPAHLARTAIEGWDPEWHWCVYIMLPTGQVSWHLHESHRPLFAHLSDGPAIWDGHTTEEKYARLAALSPGSVSLPEEQEEPPTRPQVGALRKCLVCSEKRPWGIYHEPTGVTVCLRCRDARNVIRGGAVQRTPRTQKEFFAALERVMQHYTGEHGAEYGDARFVIDYALALEDELRVRGPSLPAETWEFEEPTEPDHPMTALEELLAYSYDQDGARCVVGPDTVEYFVKAARMWRGPVPREPVSTWPPPDQEPSPLRGTLEDDL